jgi:hypothetical protein
MYSYLSYPGKKLNDNYVEVVSIKDGDTFEVYELLDKQKDENEISEISKESQKAEILNRVPMIGRRLMFAVIFMNSLNRKVFIMVFHQ